MNRQQIFDAAYRGLASQNFFQSRRNGWCAYRGEGGFRCAVGHLIPDEKYSPNLEGHSPWSRSVFKAAGLRGGQEDFAERLQRCHDKSLSPEGMKRRLHELAHEFRLQIPA